MRFAKRLLMVAGAVALAGILGVATVPKVAHGVAAALVQVVNTPTTAIPTVQAPSVGAVYNSTCSANFAGTSFASCSFTPVAQGTTLVIESASIQAATPPGTLPFFAQIAFVAGSSTSEYFIPMVFQAQTADDNFLAGSMTGRVYAPGPVPSSSATCSLNINGTGAPAVGFIVCTISGYLVPSS